MSHGGEVNRGTCVGLVFFALCFWMSLGCVQADDGQGEDPCPDPSLPWIMAHNGRSVSAFQYGKPAGSSWYVTESGYVAALEEDLLDRAILWAGMGDEAEFERFIRSNPLVFPLRSGLRVRIDKFSFSNKVRIRPEGTTISVWTVREAIRSEFPVKES